MKTWMLRGLPFLFFLAITAHLPARGDEPREKVAGPAAPVRTALRLPPDPVFDKTVGQEQAVTFRHATHVEYSDGTCVGCHPQPFKILHPSRTTSHEAMDAGASCGACHDGKGAFSTKEESSCTTCHAGSGAEGGRP